MSSLTYTWHPLPSSPANSTCTIHLLQAGGLLLPYDVTILPGPNQPNETTSPNYDPKKERARFYVPDYVFLIYHPPSKSHYLFDIGMRKDLENLAPTIVKNTLPVFKCYPESPANILQEHGSKEQQPENVKAVMFSHMHFDHVGDGAKAGFSNAELWVGPTCCTYARPGYPVDETAPTLSADLPSDGSRKIREAFVSDELLEKAGDKRAGKVKQAQEKGLYEAVDLSRPGEKGWFPLGGFDRAFDVFGDGSAYLIDAPGHSPGHQMLLVRVKVRDSTSQVSQDDFVLLAGDCYHHPALLKDPDLTARPPYSKGSMHTDPDVAIDTMRRTKLFAEQENVWVVGAHDFGVGENIKPGRGVKDGKEKIEGLVDIGEWRSKGWKKELSASL